MMKSLRSSLVLLILFSVGTSVLAQEKPKIIYILVDNWGWGDLGIQGSTVPTPRIDGLAEEGLRLTNFNVQNQCTPTRSGTQNVAAPGEPDGLAPWEYTIAELSASMLEYPNIKPGERFGGYE